MKNSSTSLPFLKWAGGKRRLLPTLLPLLPTGKRLVEPFVGAGSVFLASDIDTLVLGDSNPALMSVYRRLKADAPTFIAQAKMYFIESNRTPASYNGLRQIFNDPSTSDEIRAALFLYINRFGFNGLYRINRSGQCNTPYGHPQSLPSFPTAAMHVFADRLQTAELHCGDFESVMSQALPGDLVYCDPPYAAPADKASFTAYCEAGFKWEDQHRLANKARELARTGVTVVISNHATDATRALYRGARLHELTVRRSIAATSAARGNALELVAIFSPDDFVPLKRHGAPDIRLSTPNLSFSLVKNKVIEITRHVPQKLLAGRKRAQFQKSKFVPPNICKAARSVDNDICVGRKQMVDKMPTGSEKRFEYASRQSAYRLPDA